MVAEQIELYLKNLPDSPGVYIFKDAKENIIYVGKALNIRNRVKSYFTKVSPLPEKTSQLVKQINKIDFIVTESEIAALVLECEQIKKYKPHFNVMLKDDKNFPYIKIDINNDWPTISITRHRRNDGAKYIGRIPSAWSARQTYNYIKRIFPLRSCSKIISGTDRRSCLRYHIKRCLGPCIGAIEKDQYQSMVKHTVALLEGRENDVLRDLKRDMLIAADNMDFENAAEIRNKIQAIEAVIASNHISFNIRGERDAIALSRDKDIACIRIFSIKDSRIIADEHFIIEHIEGETDSQLLESALKLFYSSSDRIPGQILLQSTITEPDLITTWLSGKRGTSVTISVPKRGSGLRLIDMVIKNAHQQLEMYKLKKAAFPESFNVLSNLKDTLNLPKTPHRIEAYDISNIQGTNAVGSMVVFENGTPKPDSYRRFKIRLVQHTDDYAMMREVIMRRLKKYQEAEGKWSIQPDLILIDGGRGHLNAALHAMNELEIKDIPVISIAKENEDIFKPCLAEPIALNKSSRELQLLQRVRDESHRFAITYHRSLRSVRSNQSALDDIPGIGPTKKRALIRHFGSVIKIKEAKVADLVNVPGISNSLATKILEHLK